MFEDYILMVKCSVSMETGEFMNTYHNILVQKYGPKFMQERLDLAESLNLRGGAKQ